MKNLKKLASLLLALVMVFSLAISAFAAEAATTYEYEIYQIFTGDYSDGKLSNIKWGENGTGTKGAAVDDDILNALAEVNTNTATDAEKLAVIEQYANLTSTPVETTNAVTTTTTTVTGLANGYYLVKDKADTQKGENQSYTTYVVQVVNGTLTINRKAGVPEVNKVIVDGTEVTKNEASIGDTVIYKFTGTLPTNIADYDTYYYFFTDTLSKGLTLTDPDADPETEVDPTNDIQVTVNDVDVTDYFYINASAYSETDGTTITVGMPDILALTVNSLTCNNTEEGHEHVEGCYADDAILDDPITASTKVVVTYSATLNEDAVIGGDGNPNEVKLEYSNNPNDDGEGATTPPTPPTSPDKPTPTTPTGETPEEKVVTYTTNLIIKKTDESGNALPNAAFEITGDSVNIVVTTGECYVVDNTEGTYYKLKNGTYTTTAPATEDVDENNSADYADLTNKYKKATQVTLNTNNENVNAEAFVDSATGLLTFTGLGAGTYTITETVTPAGYNSIAPIMVTIDWTAAGGFTYTGTDFEDKDNNKVQDEGEININWVTVVNKAGSNLPTTGGMGTTLFYVFGGILVAAAVVLLVTKKRVGESK